MIFTELELQNFMAFENVHFTYKSGIHFIYGLNFDMVEDDEEQNNAVGKSTLCVEAIEWILWGSLSRTTSNKADDVVNIVHGKDCYGRVKFYGSGGQEWEVIRTRKHSEYGNSLRWWIDGEEKTLHDTTESKSKLADFLPLSRDLFRQVVQLGQENEKPFVEMSESDKQNLICKMVGLNVYDDAFEKAKQKVSAFDFEVGSCENNCKDIAGNLELLETKISEVERDISSVHIQKSQINIDDHLRSLETLQVSIKDLEGSLSIKQSLLQKYDASYTFLVGDLSKKRHELDKVIVTARDQKSEAMAIYDAEVENLRGTEKDRLQDLSTAKANVVSISSYLEELRNSTACPTCKRPYDNSTDIQVQIDEAQNSLNGLQDIETESKEKCSSLQSILDEAIGKREYGKQQWGSYIGKLENDRDQELSSVQKDLDNLLVEKLSTQKEIENIESSLVTNRQRVEQANLLIEKSKSQLQVYESELIKLKERKCILEEQRDELKTSSAFARQKLDSVIVALEHWRYWKTSVPNLRAAAIQEVLDFVNQRILVYLHEFSSNTISVDLYQKIRGKGSKIDTSLTTPGGSYAMSSTGERKRVNLAVCLAFSDLLSAVSGVSCNLIIADEVTNGLCPAGIRKLVRVLRTKADAGKCVMVISHNGEIRNLSDFGSIIKIEKRNKIAQIIS